MSVVNHRIFELIKLSKSEDSSEALWAIREAWRSAARAGYDLSSAFTPSQALKDEDKTEVGNASVAYSNSRDVYHCWLSDLNRSK